MSPPVNLADEPARATSVVCRSVRVKHGKLGTVNLTFTVAAEHAADAFDVFHRYVEGEARLSLEPIESAGNSTRCKR